MCCCSKHSRDLTIYERSQSSYACNLKPWPPTAHKSDQSFSEGSKLTNLRSSLQFVSLSTPNPPNPTLLRFIFISQATKTQRRPLCDLSFHGRKLPGRRAFRSSTRTQILSTSIKPDWITLLIFAMSANKTFWEPPSRKSRDSSWTVLCGKLFKQTIWLKCCINPSLARITRRNRFMSNLNKSRELFEWSSLPHQASIGRLFIYFSSPAIINLLGCAI